MPPPALTRRELNRALLARQMLLKRVRVPIRDAVEALVGLQAQATLPPYLGLHARLEGFQPEALGRMLEEREVVRITLMRGTIHLVTAADALFLRPLLADMLRRRSSPATRTLTETEVGTIPERVNKLLSESPLTARELATLLLEDGLNADLTRLTQNVAGLVPMVQIPPRGVWGKSGTARYALLTRWVDGNPSSPSLPDLVRRYLAAFGPASVMDMQNWSGLTRLRSVFEELGDELVRFSGEDGELLFDLPEAPRPPADTPVPVRFLGEYDNLLLGHRDRRRVIPKDFPWDAMLAPGRFVNNLLVDGVLRATWWVDRSDDGEIGIRPDRPFTPRERAAVLDEADALVSFLAPLGPIRDVRFEPAVCAVSR